MIARRRTLGVGMGVGAVIGGVAGLPAVAAAQTAAGTYVEASASALRVRSDLGTVEERLAGVGIGLAGGIGLGPLRLEGRYVRGTADGDSPAFAERDVIEVEALAGLRVHPSITLKAGPHGRAYTTEAGTRRLIFLEGRFRAETPMVPERAAVYVELWGSVLGSTNMSNDFRDGHGGEVGLVVFASGRQLFGRVAYRVDRGTGDDPSYVDTIEYVTLALGVRLP